MLAELAPSGRAGSHHELEVRNGGSDHAVRFWPIERPHAARERQKTGSSWHADRDVVRRQGHGAIHICCSLRRQGLAVGERAALKCLAGLEQARIAAPDQRLRMVWVGRQRVGDQFHGAVECCLVTVHAGEHVLTHLEVEALLGEDRETGRKRQHKDSDQAHGVTIVERRARRSRLASQPMPMPATMPPTAPET